MRHAGLVAHKCSHVDWLGRVIPRERLALATMTATALTGQEAQRTTARVFELTVRLEKLNASKREARTIVVGVEERRKKMGRPT